MHEWKKIQRKYCISESIGIIALILFCCLGIYLDWNVLVKNNICIYVNEIESYALTILQIQAAIGTLIIAIIALITGNISDSYMGVSLSDFYLNIRPWKLKQKNLIIISLILSLIGVSCYSLRLYNVIFWTFVGTLIVIIISIQEVYSVFRGKSIGEYEIEKYIDFILEGNIELKKKEIFFQNFVNDWREIVEAQNKQSFEKYFTVFRKCMISIWEDEKNQSLAFIQQQCYDMAYCILNAENNASRGIEFIQEIYSILWCQIIETKKTDNTVLNKYKTGFNLFWEICDELMWSMDAHNIEQIEREIRFGSLVDYVQRIDIWLQGDEREDVSESRNYDNEIGELARLARFIGKYIQKQINRGNIVNIDIWEKELEVSYAFSVYNVPQNSHDVFLKSKVKIYFNLCYGLILNGQGNIVKQGLYINGIKNMVALDNKYQAIFCLSVHCYLYYLAVRESEECISEDIKLIAQSILNDEEVGCAFAKVVDLLTLHEQWMDLDVLRYMQMMLGSYEEFSKKNNYKRLIMKEVVEDFYVFLMLLMSRQYWTTELLDKNIDEKEMLKYILRENEHTTREMLKELFEHIVVGEESDKRIDEEVENMYASLEDIIKKKQKTYYIKQAEDSQKKYEATCLEDEICTKIKEETTKHIKRIFAPILTDTDEKNGLIKVKLLCVDSFTESLVDSRFDGYYSHIDGAFLRAISNFLYTRNDVIQKNRFKEFVDEEEFINYLDSKKLYILLGSRFLLKNRDYEMKDKYDQFLERCETIYTMEVNEGIALKKNAIQVCLHDVNVAIHSASVMDEKNVYDMGTGIYHYEVINGLTLDFTSDEFRKFIYNHRKIINITAKISIQVNESPCGTIFTNGKISG